jgi:hypothetical protein
MTRILLTDTGIVLDGQRVEGEPVQRTPWYARASRLRVPVNAALRAGVSLGVPAESVAGVPLTEIPDTVAFEVVHRQGEDHPERDVYDPGSFLSFMRHSWVITKDVLYFVAWFDRYWPLDGAWYADLSDATPFTLVPILAMVATRAHVANCRMDDGAYGAWFDDLDPTVTVVEAVQTGVQRLAAVSDAYTRLVADAQHAYDALITEKVTLIVEALNDAISGIVRGPPNTGNETEPTDPTIAMDERPRTYTRFPANDGVVEIDAEFLNVKVGDIPPGITVRVKPPAGYARHPFYALTDLELHHRHIRFRVRETQYVEAAHVVETLLEHLGLDATPSSDPEGGNTFDVELALDANAIVEDVLIALFSGMEALAGPSLWRAAVERVLTDQPLVQRNDGRSVSVARSLFRDPREDGHDDEEVEQRQEDEGEFRRDVLVDEPAEGGGDRAGDPVEE